MDIIYLLIIVTIICLSIYLILHTASFALTVLASTKKRKLMLRNKYLNKNYLNNIIVITYCHNQEKASAYMLEALNKQNYSKMNCQFHFILDNCTDNTANMLEFIGGAKLWKVGDGITLGKDKSISWLLERLIHVKNTDAFVFLDVERGIEEDFLDSINKSLMSNDVIIGDTEIIFENNDIFSKVIQTLNTYKNRIINTGRTILGLVSFVDINCFVIKHSILEEIKYIDFKSTISRYKYTLLLAKKNYYCCFDPNIKSKMPLKQYLDMQETFANRFSLAVRCIPLFIKLNFKFNELVMSLIMPSLLSIICITAILLCYTSLYYFFLDVPIFIATTAILIFMAVLSLVIGNFSIKEDLILSTSFLIKIFYKLSNIKSLQNIKRMIKGDKNVPYIKTATKHVVVTDGKNNLQCELELISEDGMSKATLKFKKKKYSSDYYLRMYDAINDIISTLNEHGFRVKICASCGYFTSLIDGTTNMIKGTCNKCVVDKLSQDPMEVLIWNGCENFIPQEINKVVDMAAFRTNN